MSRMYVVIGPRRSGKTHRALEWARKAGKSFGVLLPTDELRAAFEKVHPDIPCATLLPKHPTVPWVNIIVDDAHLLGSGEALSAAALVIDSGGFVVFVASPPSEQRAGWLIGLAEEGSKDIPAELLPPALWPATLHAALGEVTADGEPIRFAPDAAVQR